MVFMNPIMAKKLKQMKKDWIFYLFLLPAASAILVFNYIPMYGVQLAFKNFRAIDGIWGSPWTGFANLNRFMASPQFIRLIRNTVTISLYQLIAGFPIPILFALLLNYCISQKLKKTVQILTYAPHFISIVVLVAMVNLIFSTSNGPVNHIIAFLGGTRKNFLAETGAFRHMFVWSGIWQNMGWSAIIYIAALSSVDQEMHEAAIIDGAVKIQRMWYIDLPCIMPTAIIMLILAAGNIMSVGFEKAFLMQNSVNLNVSEIISTYVYKVGLLNSDFGFSTAVNLFNNLINFFLLLGVNALARKFSETSLF